MRVKSKCIALRKCRMLRRALFMVFWSNLFFMFGVAEIIYAAKIVNDMVDRE